MCNIGRGLSKGQERQTAARWASHDDISQGVPNVLLMCY